MPTKPLRLGRLALALALASAMATGCGSPPAPKGPVVFEEDSRPREEAPLEHVEIERTRVGNIPRAELLQQLDEGVGVYLASVDVQAHAPDGRFAGWEVLRFGNEWVDLVPGDVVVAVNGRRIETPTQVQALWESLRTASEIVVSATRAGQAFELRFAVQGAIEAQTP